MRARRPDGVAVSRALRPQQVQFRPPDLLALMFPVKGEGVLVGLLADGEQCKLLKLHKAGDGAVDDG